MSKGARRKGINRDRVRKRAAEKQQSGGLSTLLLPEGVEQFTPKKGPNLFDILNYVVNMAGHPEAAVGDEWYERTFWIHRGVGPENKWVICPLKTWGDPCPVCEDLAILGRDEEADEDYIKSLWPKQRQAFNVFDKGPKATGDVQVYESSYHTFGKQLEEEVSMGDEGNSGFSDLVDGRTVEARFSESSGGTYTFLEASRIDFRPRKDYDDDVLDEVVDLDAAIKAKTMSYEDLAKLHRGTGGQAAAPVGTVEEGTAPVGDTTTAVPEAGPPPEGTRLCTACEGDGKNTRGKTCRICGGDGHVPDEGGAAEPATEEPVAHEVEEPQPRRGRRGRAPAAPAAEATPPPAPAAEAPAAAQVADEWGSGDDWK